MTTTKCLEIPKANYKSRQNGEVEQSTKWYSIRKRTNKMKKTKVLRLKKKFIAELTNILNFMLKSFSRYYKFFIHSFSFFFLFTWVFGLIFRFVVFISSFLFYKFLYCWDDGIYDYRFNCLGLVIRMWNTWRPV